jgi:ABC-2 type transport system permease protein
MNTQANTASGSTVPRSLNPKIEGAQPPPAAVLSATRPFYWSVRRELWENRSIYIAPLAAAALFLLGFLISTIHLPQQIRDQSTPAPVHEHQTMVAPHDGAVLTTMSQYDTVAGLLMLTAMVVGVFYCLDALHGERRDRSILFWKSLPVSDTTAVLAKASIPLVVLPLITFVVTVAAQWIMLLVSSAILLANGLSVATLWTQVAILPMSLMLFYHLLTVHVLWHAPFYGWLLLVSAWARRAAFLWAVLPVVAVAFVEKIAFNTSHFATMLGDRLGGGAHEAITAAGSMPIHPGIHITLGRYLSAPGLWIGLAFTAICLAAAIRLRRQRGPI